jgi:hypothetical protein
VSQPEQLTVERGAEALRPLRRDGERAARGTLRAQIGRLERELSGIVTDGFPRFSPCPGLGPSDGRPADGLTGAAAATGEPFGGPRLLSLEQLELMRDRLAGRVQDLRHCEQQCVERQQRAHELLVRMKREPARYKFVRLPVTELGQGGCGVWEVRPRLGLIGMLAGWWQLKLSSGCPLERGPRSRRGPSRRS